MFRSRDLKKRARILFSLDLRSLALMRVAFSVVLLGDLILKLANAGMFYGVRGVASPQVLEHIPPGWGNFWGPLSFMGGLESAVPVLPFIIFTIAILATLCMLIGWRTRFAAACAFISVALLGFLDPLVTYGADEVVQLVLFLGIFLPWGERYSVDSALFFDKKGEPSRVATPWTWALLSQISLIYLFASLEKLSSPLWRAGGAINATLVDTPYATPIAHALAQVPFAPHLIDWAVPIFQLSVIVLIFIPFFNVYFRTTAMALLMAMHFSFAMCLRIGIFSWLMIAVLTVLLPSGFWDWLARHSGRRFGKITIYYDGNCSFCKKSSYLLRTFLLLPGADVRQAQEKEDVFADMRARSSWVIEDAHGGRTFGFAGMAALMAHSPLFFFIVPIMRLTPVAACGERLYRLVARNRSWIPLPSARRSTPAPRAWRGIVSIIAAAAFLMVGITYSALVLTGSNGLAARDFMFAAATVGLEQHWDLFTPGRPGPDILFVADGTLADGTHVDLFNSDRAPSYSRPADPSAAFPNMLWRRYFTLSVYLPLPSRMYSYDAYGSYECQNWNAGHAEAKRLAAVTLTIAPDPQAPPFLLREERLLRYSCSESSPEA